MKINKKLIVPFLSSVIGLSIAGGLGGAFAWYQFNSQVTASFIGSSVADTSILQIGHKETVNNVETMKWGRDFYPYMNNAQDMIPVTFGQTIENAAGKENCLNENAKGYPEAGKQVGDGYDNWLTIDPNKGYARFEMYLRALKADGTQADLDVYLSDVLIEVVGQNTPKVVEEAVRIHLDVEGNDDPNRLISKTAVPSLNLYGPLDLDGDNKNDTTGGYINGNATIPGSTITYGRNLETQTTIGISDIVAARDGETQQFPASESAKKICTTKTGTDTVKIVVTVWLEGWALLKTTTTDDTTSNIWNASLSAGVNLRVGMTFDTGVIRL